MLPTVSILFMKREHYKNDLYFKYENVILQWVIEEKIRCTAILNKADDMYNILTRRVYSCSKNNCGCSRDNKAFFSFYITFYKKEYIFVFLISREEDKKE